MYDSIHTCNEKHCKGENDNDDQNQDTDNQDH